MHCGPGQLWSSKLRTVSLRALDKRVGDDGNEPNGVDEPRLISSQQRRRRASDTTDGNRARSPCHTRNVPMFIPIPIPSSNPNPNPEMRCKCTDNASDLCGSPVKVWGKWGKLLTTVAEAAI
ncbi:hypothetical protein ACLKA6_005899 [Drosophila palustris]